MFKNICINPNCKAEYESEYQDEDFCPLCIKKNKRLAAEIDKQLAGKASKKAVKSDFQFYDEMCRATGTKFPKA